MRLASPSLVLLLLAGCAVLGDVTPLGDGSYMASAHSNDVNARVDDEKAKVMERAQAFCAAKQAGVEVIRVVASAPPPGQPPQAEVDFRCGGPLR